MTDEQSVVLTLDYTEQTPYRLYNHIRNLTIERDKLLHQWMSDLGQEVTLPTVETIESNHLAIELADWKARLRKQRQEL